LNGNGIIGAATGGQGVVTQPTWFLAGEAGVPEAYSFSPLGQQNSAGGGYDTDRIIMAIENLPNRIKDAIVSDGEF
jgi:hypothetical protein